MFTRRFDKKIKSVGNSFLLFLVSFSLASGLFYVPSSPLSGVQEVNAAVAANGSLFYGYTTSAGLLVSRDITANDTYATAFTEVAAGSASGVTFVRAEYAPTRNEALVGSLKVDGRLDVHTCIGDCNAQADLVDQFGKTAVSATSTCDTTAGGCTRPFDLAYEQLSGDAMVVFIDTASDGTIKYCTYNGSAWTPASCGTPSSYTFNAGSTVDAKWVRLVPYQVGMKGARSDEMMMVVVDTNNDIFAARWDGSAWGNLTTITTTATTSNTQVFDVAWEQSTGDAMVVWGEGTTASTQPARYKKWTRSNTTWDGSATSLPVQTGTHLVNWVAMAGAPTEGKNHIAVFLQTATTAGNNCSTATNCSAVPYIWDGSSMTKGTQWASTESTLQRGIDVAIESLNSIVNAFFVSSLGATADETGYETWIEGTGFAGGNTDNLAGTTGDMGDDADGVVIRAHPGSNDIQILGRNIDDSVQQHRWDGSATKTAGWSTLVSATIAPGAITANANGPEGQAWGVAMRAYSPWSRNWRFYDGADTAATPTTSLAAENTTPTNFDPTTGKTRLRFSVQELSAHAQTDGRKKLQFTTDSPDSLSATWTDVDDAGGAGLWRYVDCNGGTGTCDDNTTLSGTVLSGSPTAGWWTQDKDAAGGTNMDHSASQLRELEYSIEANGAVGETTYYFRMYDVDQMTPVFREQDNDGSNDCATAVCTYPSITTGKRTILGDGTDGASVTLAPGDGAQEIGRFSLQTSNSTDTVTGMTVTLGGGANAYQNIATVDVQTAPASSWTQQTASGSRHWWTVNSSSDGQKLFATTSSQYLYTSTDGGASWTERTGAGTGVWRGSASSADGMRLAAAPNGGYIYTSTDGGANWTQQTNSGARSWFGMASSADGMRLVAVVSNGYIYTSSDGGVTWVERTGAGTADWRDVASSADGTKLVVVGNAYIYTSTDAGASWTQRVNDGTYWWRVTSSADGTNLAAGTNSGYINTSTNSGQNWTPQTNSGWASWYGIGSSANGSKIVAGSSTSSYLRTSSDGGVNWSDETGPGLQVWTDAAYSADGNRIVAVTYPGYIYTYGHTGVSQCSATPSSNTVVLTGCNISVNSTPTEYKIMITPKTHANMPAVPGASYDVTATVTSVTATNTVAGTDTDSATVTIDNLSPNNATSTSGTAGTGAVTLNWTASNSADISQSVVLRWASGSVGAEVPVEGTQYVAGNTIGTATVACVLGSTASQSHASIVDGTGGTTGCNTSALTNGQAYSYKVFSKDIRNNYDAGVTVSGGPFTPNLPFSVSGTSSGLSDGTIVRVVINGSLDANASSTITSNAWSVDPSGADPTAGQSVVVFVTDGDGDIADNLEATAVSVYDGSGEMSGISLVPGTLAIGSANSQSVALSNIDDYTCSSDEDVMHSVSSNVLNLQGCSNSYSGETLLISGSNTLTVATAETITTEKLSNTGAITVTGSPTFNIDGTSGTLIANSGTFTQGTSTVNLRGNGDATVNLVATSPTFYNLISSGTGTKTLGAGITIATNGTLTVSAGTFDPAGYLVTGSGTNTLAVSSGATLDVDASTFAGNYSAGFGTITLNSNSTTTYSLGGTQTVSATPTYGHLTISGSGTKTLGGNTTVAGTVSVTAGTLDTDSGNNRSLQAEKLVINGGTLNANASTITLTGTSGTLFDYSNGTFTAGTSTVTLSGNGSATINSGSPTFNHLISSGTGTKTLGANIGVNGNLTVQGGGIFDPSTYTVSMIGGTVSNTDSTIRIGGTLASNSFSGVGGVSRSGTTYVEYSRSGDQTVSNSSAYRFGDNLTISGSGTKTMAGSASFNATHIQSGTLALSNTTLTLTGTGTGVLSGNGTLNGGTGTVKFTGDGSVTIPAKGYYHLDLSPTITGNRTYTLDATTVTGNLTINPTAASAFALTTNMGANLTVTGTTTITKTTSATATLDTDTGTDRDLTTGALSIQTGGTLDAGGSASEIDLTGTSGTLFTVNGGTFTPGNSSLVLSGNGNAIINSGIDTFNGVTVSGTGIKTASSALTLNGSLNISNASGTLNMAGYDLTVSGSVTNSGTFNTGTAWEYSRPVTIDYTKVVNTTQTDFPVLISGTYDGTGGEPDLRSVANGGKIRNASGHDIAFYADAALTTPLAFEQETWNGTTGAINYWVKIPSLSHTANTTIYMAYGNPSVTAFQGDSQGTWDSGYKGVWHLPDGTTLNTADSTVNTNNATNTEVTAVSGKIGGGAGIIESGDKLTIADISLTGGVYTISTWFKMPLSGNATGWNTLTRGSNNDHQVIVNRSNGELGMYKNGQGDFRTSGYDMDGLSNGWHHLVAKTSGTTTLFYIDGSYVGTSDSISTAEITTLGNYQLYTQPWGEIDELRISTGVSRSVDWIATEYNNQNDPSTFYSIGSETTLGGVDPVVTLSGTGTVWNNSGTVSAGTSTFKLTNTSASEKTFVGGGGAYNNLWLAGGNGGGDYVITGNNTFNDFKTDGSAAHTISFDAGSTQTLRTFTVAGTAGNEVTLTSTTSTPFTLIKTGSADVESDYLAIQYSTVSPYGAWTAGTHSTDMGSNSGWIFNTPGGSRGGGSGGNAGGESSGGGQGNTGGEGTCSDGIQNGNETGVDSGGRCTVGGGGGTEGGGGGDGNTGGEGTCSDGIQNGNETGVDTGGRCTTGGGGGDVGFNLERRFLASTYDGVSKYSFSLSSFFQKFFRFL